MSMSLFGSQPTTKCSLKFFIWDIIPSENQEELFKQDSIQHSCRRQIKFYCENQEENKRYSCLFWIKKHKTPEAKTSLKC